jgi:cytosine/adenosine deaminase-related metal-dependent hydrolase
MRSAIRARWTVLPDGVVEGATVVVEGTRIVDVVRSPVDVPADRTVTLTDGIVFPGFVNLHNHSINGPIFRGIVDDRGGADALVYALLMPIGDLAARLLSDDDVRAIYRLALVELAHSGVTTVLDMPRVAHRSLFAVAKEVGLRVYGAPYMFSTPPAGVDDAGRPVYGPGDEEGSLRDVRSVYDEYDDGPGGLVRIGFGPHATDTCGPDFLRRIAAEARDRGATVSIHVAQSHLEVDTIRDRYGHSPVEYLDAVGLLGPNLVAAHCVYVEPADLDRLRDSGTTVANCPLTFARSGVTVAFDRFHRHGVATGIGTDAYSFDVFAELRAAGFVSKLAGGDGTAADAATLLRAATAVGAAALPWPDVGRIAPGAAADLVAVDLGAPHLQPVRDPVRNLVWNATPADVSLVLVNGRPVVADGAVVGCDERAVVRRAADAVHRLWDAAERAGVLR